MAGHLAQAGRCGFDSHWECCAIRRVIWFVIQLTQGWTDFLRGGLQGGGIAWWAHIAGFLAGVALIRPFDPWGGPRRRAGMPRGPWG